jgi:tryptophanyl-tRNA synthetase
MNRSLSGIKPTGEIHIGNYFGAISQFVDHQSTGFDNFVFVANYHAMTNRLDAEALRRETFSLVRAYLACGLDPKKTTLFLQSDVPLLGELTWIFNCLISMSKLERAHAYKDSVAKDSGATVALFDYPVLMAADILMYSSDVVPVGKDQKQHVEYARDLAEKFNREFGELFTVPEPVILDEVAVVPGIDGQKMSKSYGNTIGLFEPANSLKKKVMSIVTDSLGVEEVKDPNACKVFALHKLFSSDEEIADLESKYRAGGFGYGDSKKLLLEKMESFIAPLRERYEAISDEEVVAVLKDGAVKARDVSEEMMKRVRKMTGLSL